MSDSDETLYDDGEEQMSPSIIAPIRRKHCLDHNTPFDCEITVDSGGSPEFLPPSAKIQKLSKEKERLAGELAKTHVYQEIQSPQVQTAFNTEKPAAERLKSIKEQEEKIEGFLVSLESNVKRGVSLKECPLFAQAKLLMTQVKTQLADFTRYQQQQRQAIAKSSNESQGTRDGAESQYTSNIKQRILELATQQKELLKCFQCHKKLLEKIQALKQEAKSVTKHILPAVEEHHKSCNKQQDISDKSAHPPLSNPFEVTTSNKSTTGSNKQVGKQSVDSRLTPLMSSLKPAKSLLDSSTASSSAFHVTHSGGQSQLQLAATSCTSASVFHNIPSVTQTQSSMTPSVTSQPRVQNVVLTTGQLYQVGNRQVCVLPQGLIPSITSSAMTQVAQPQPVTPAEGPSDTTSAATERPGIPTNALMPNVTMAKSTQGCTQRDQTAQPFPHLSSQGDTQLPRANVTMPVSSTTSLRNSSTLPVSNNRIMPSTSSTSQQNITFSVASRLSNQGSKEMAFVINRTSTCASISPNANTTAPHFRKSVRVQSQCTPPSQNTVEVHRSIQATKTTTSFDSKAPVVQAKSNQSLQRRNSFGSDLPDMKSLLSHNAIEAGSNVLSIKFEGRNFEASLRASGLIESAGGETFRTPMAWMRAVTRSWNTVKQSQAYKMVHYKGKPLALFTIPSEEKESCVCRGSKTADVAQDQQDKTMSKENRLITNWDDVAQLLTNCRVMPVGRDELFPTDSFLPVNFWDSTDEDIPQHVLEELDF